MRGDELATVSLAHKAFVISDKASKGMLHINTDGTTLQQKKLGGIAIENMVISVNEQPSGSADSIISDVSNQLERLRTMANALGLPHSDSINWTLVSCSTSDSALTQKRFNKLMEECRQEDKEKFGNDCSADGLGIIENFCAMHLGCNLRKAFLVGVRSQLVEVNQSGESSNREYYAVDTLVHEFHKLFGRHGTPEYGCGSVYFPDYLELMSTDSSTSPEDSIYYRSCLNLTRARQVGSRYFVTAANASKILYLRQAAISFLEYTGRAKGNKLEKDVYSKLKDPVEVVQLRLDALMFYHLYADLVTLVKSRDLQKSVLDMNVHYLEIKMFLNELQHNPQKILSDELTVFKSEQLLYGCNKKVNHRIRDCSKLIKDYVFSNADNTLLFTLCKAGAASMESKPNTYAHAQLPGGLYWEPEKEIRDILKDVEPSNDICESILGLNDYLSTAIPNLSQGARSNLVEVKKNKTMKWLDSQPEDKQDMIIGMAAGRRHLVCEERKQDGTRIANQRRKRLQQEHVRRQVLEERAEKEKFKLSEAHLITSAEELYHELNKDDYSTAMKLKLLRTQVNIRKKILKQEVPVALTHSRKQRPVNRIIDELAEFIANNSSPASVLSSPASLIVKPIKHRFIVEESEDKWYNGKIIDYDFENKLFEIVYENEDEHYYFDLAQDIMLGDLVIV